MTPEEELQERSGVSDLPEDEEEDWWCFYCEEYRCRHGWCRTCEGCEVCDPENFEEEI